MECYPFTLQNAERQEYQTIPELWEEYSLKSEIRRTLFRVLPVFPLNWARHKEAQNNDPIWDRIAVRDQSTASLLIKLYSAPHGPETLKFFFNSPKPAYTTPERYKRYCLETFNPTILDPSNPFEQSRITVQTFCAKVGILPLALNQEEVNPPKSPQNFALPDDPIWLQLGLQLDAFQDFVIYTSFAEFFQIRYMTEKTKHLWVKEEKRAWTCWENQDPL